jgi:hypothetical protein
MKLFYDDEFDAIATAIGNSGKPFKLVAAHIFPDMKPESAYARPVAAYGRWPDAPGR